MARPLLVVLFFAVQVLAQPHADRVIVHKSTRRMDLMHAGKILKTYKIALGEIRSAQKDGKEITKRQRAFM